MKKETPLCGLFFCLIINKEFSISNDTTMSNVKILPHVILQLTT